MAAEGTGHLLTSFSTISKHLIVLFAIVLTLSTPALLQQQSSNLSRSTATSCNSTLSEEVPYVDDAERKQDIMSSMESLGLQGKFQTSTEENTASIEQFSVNSGSRVDQEVDPEYEYSQTESRINSSEEIDTTQETTFQKDQEDNERHSPRKSRKKSGSKGNKQFPPGREGSRCTTQYKNSLTDPEGDIVWMEPDSGVCIVTYQWFIEVHVSDGIVLEFKSVELQNNSTLRILQVDGRTLQPKLPPLWHASHGLQWINTAPLLVKSNQLLVEIQTPAPRLNTSQSSHFSLSYAAHSLQFIPEELHISNDSLRTSSAVYNCSKSHGHIPKAMQCDMIQQCAYGEDEQGCPYKQTGCGDWVPYGEQCLKAFFLPVTEFSPGSSHVTMPVHANDVCRTEFQAKLARLPDRSGMQLVGEMIRQSGYRSASIGLRKMKPSSTSLKHLYKYIWQWGIPGSPVAYEQVIIQRMNAVVDCAVFDLNLQYYLRPVPCNIAPFKETVPDGFVCMRANTLKPKPRKRKRLTHLHLTPARKRKIRFANKNCSDGSFVHMFHDCKWQNFNTSTDQPTPTFPKFQCELGKDVHYSYVCDGVDDCVDGSDEINCEPPRFRPLLSTTFTCTNLQNVPKKKKCNGISDCFDNSDEEDCIKCKKNTALCPGLECIPKSYRTFFNSCLFPGSDSYSHLELFSPAAVELDGFGMSSLKPVGKDCDEGYFKCDSGLCIPVFLLNNGEQDCPSGMDERIPVDNFTCPGYYRCKSGNCVHSRHVCDGINHCPDKDDERYCDLSCPQNCTCEGYVYKCMSMFDPLQHLNTRYLDLSGIVRPNLNNMQMMEYLRVLNLSHCELEKVNLISMPQLETLDLSFNRLKGLSSVVFMELTGLKHLSLSNNPFVNRLDSTFVQFVQASGITSLRHLSLTNTQLCSIADDTLSSLPKLSYLDIRGNGMINFDKNVFNGLSRLRKLDTDQYKFCCSYFHSGKPIAMCRAPMNELSSCDDLLGGWFYQISVWILAAINIPANIAVLAYRMFEIKTKRSRVCTVLVANLCLSDLLMGVYLVFIGSADVHYRDVWVSRETEWRSSALCKTAGILAFLSNEVSAFAICLITLERLLVICFPLKKNLHVKSGSALFACVGMWLLGLLLAFLPMMVGWDLYGENGFCLPLPITRNQFPGQTYLFAVFIYVNFFLFILIGIGQVCIYRAIMKTRLCNTPRCRQQDMTIARRLMLIIVTDFCCWFPIGLMGILASLGTAIPGEVNVWAALFILPFNSALNPHLYTINGIVDRYKERRMERRITKTMGKINSEIQKWPADKVEALLKTCLRARIVPQDKVLLWVRDKEGCRIGGRSQMTTTAGEESSAAESEVTEITDYSK